MCPVHSTRIYINKGGGGLARMKRPGIRRPRRSHSCCATADTCATAVTAAGTVVAGKLLPALQDDLPSMKIKHADSMACRRALAPHPYWSGLACALRQGST